MGICFYKTFIFYTNGLFFIKKILMVLISKYINFYRLYFIFLQKSFYNDNFNN